MPSLKTILVVNDIHYAGAREQQRRGHESRAIPNPLLRLLVHAWRHYVWLRDPFAHNHLLDSVLSQAKSADLLIANGDYSCDTAFVGVSDDAACESAQECLGKLRQHFGDKMHATMGDHELGKMSLFGGRGGMRMASWRRAQLELNLKPFWQIELGRYVFLGVASSLIAFPVYEPEALPSERVQWHQLRAAQFTQIRQAFSDLKPSQRVILFCHDPTALPFLWADEEIRRKLSLVEQTMIGHLHSKLIFWKSQLLAGMPPIRFLGNSIRRMSEALNQAKYWRPFKVRLCPSLAGSELLKDGGYYRVTLDLEAREPARFEFHSVPRK